MNIPSYSSIYNVGHKALETFFDEPVCVEEKVDGSQFSFMVDSGGVLHYRSKGAEVFAENPGMFDKAVESVQQRRESLIPGWVYRAEYLRKPKHNALAYNRTPKDHLIIFDIDTGNQDYLSPVNKKAFATSIGLECVPVLYIGKVFDWDMATAFLERLSVLEGQKIEGLVFKRVEKPLFGNDKKLVMAKHVSEAFKEVARGEWKKSNPGRADVVQGLVTTYRTPARWEKAVFHLRDQGTLEGTPRDIGSLIKEVGEDVMKECEEEIKNILWRHFWPEIRRGITRGLPEWWKNRLGEEQFNGS